MQQFPSQSTQATETVILTYTLDQWFPTEVPGCHELMLFNISIKNKFSNCHQTLKQIAIGLPMGATYLSLL